MHPVIAHLGIAVADLDASLAFYRDVLGLQPRGTEEADGARIAHLAFGDSEVELLQSVVDDSPIARFIARRGPGLHHVCYRVADLDAALAACRLYGYTLIDETPRLGAGGHRIAFVHPKAGQGTLIELTE
ncbi:MAG TPA: methylmalonyl-CoA epimerase [Gemmatimonadales bacterium]|jgi:methylmalonyl-CoA/ethylmalonyl-CoA epimerase